MFLVPRPFSSSPFLEIGISSSLPVFISRSLMLLARGPLSLLLQTSSSPSTNPLIFPRKFDSISFLRDPTMSSETDSSEISSMFESLLRQEGGFSLFLSFMLGLTREPDPTGDRTVLIDPSTRTVLIVRSQSSLDAFLNGVVRGKRGRLPALKSAVEGMPRVEIKGKEEGSCAVCLEEWSAGDVAAEMPCKHRFHSKCVEEWLGIHGTCPVCRYEMPVEEKEETDKKVEILFRIAINGGGRRIREGEERDAGGETDSEPTTGTEVV